MLPHRSAISAGPLLDFLFNCYTGILLFFHFFHLVLFFVFFYYLLVDPLQVPVMPCCLVRDSWVFSLVQTGWRFPMQGQCFLCHPMSGNLLSGSSISPQRSLFHSPSTFGGKVSAWWEWRQWCLCNSCTKICQHGSQDVSCTAQNRCP